MSYDLQIVARKKRRAAPPGEPRRSASPVAWEKIPPVPARRGRGGYYTAAVRAKADRISVLEEYPKGGILFLEGDPPRGVFEIAAGRLKLSTGSADGRSLILRMAGPGDLVGLPGTLSGRPHQATAEAIEPLRTRFISRPKFVRWLRDHGDASFQTALVLSEICHATYDAMRCIGLAGTARQRLARFLLDRRPQSKLALTHDQIGQMLGISRETVTRLFAEFKRNGYIELRGSSLSIVNDTFLRSLIAE